MSKIKVAGVAFSKNGRKYYFDSNGFNLKIGLTVIVETERGLQFGYVEELKEMDKSQFQDSLKKIIRISTKKDYNQYLNNIKDSKNAFNKCKELIIKNNLDMKLIDASYNFERTQLYFTYL